MKKICSVTTLAFILSACLSGSALASAFPRPAPRDSDPNFDSRRVLEELRRQYPNVRIPDNPSEVQWITPTGEPVQPEEIDLRFSPDPHQVAQYDDDFFDDLDRDWGQHIQLERDIRDARMGQHWLDIKEDLALREIDNKALQLVQEFASAKHAIPPSPGMNGAVNYNFGDHIPRIVCRPNRVTNIMLQPGEKVTAVHAGDTTRWQINPAMSGTGENETVHVIIKPLVPDISTNLLVMTDRRTYNLDLLSSNSEFIPSIRFSYPDDAMHAWDKFIAENRARRQNELVLSEGANVSPENLFFGYEITRGRSLPWSPVRVFDDGSKTYIEMPARYRSMEAPVLLFYEGRQQKLVNYRVKDHFYIVDRIMTRRAVLIAGQDRVIIERKRETDGGR